MNHFFGERYLVIGLITSIFIVSCEQYIVEWDHQSFVSDFDLGVTAYQDGNYQDAISFFSNDLATKGESYSGYMHRFRANRSAGNHQAAVGDLFHAFGLCNKDYYETGDGKYLLFSVQCLYLSGDKERADQSLDFLIQRHPHLEKELGVSFEAMKRSRELEGIEFPRKN